MITEQQTKDTYIVGEPAVAQAPVVAAAPAALPPTAPAKQGLKKRATPARFITPLQGVIVKENDRVVFESVIDGECSQQWNSINCYYL